MPRTVVGLFDNPNDAQSAYAALQSAGSGQDNISLVTNASVEIFDQLVGIGVPRDDATLYANGVLQGGNLIVAQAVPDNQADQIADILDRFNVVDIGSRGQLSQQTTSDRSTSGRSSFSNNYQGGGMVVPIVEEQIQVGTREVERGGVRVNVDVEEVPVQEQVTLRDEQVHVERRAINQTVDPSQAENLFQQGTVEIRETDEQAVVGKQARVVEEVVINKEVEQRTETIRDSVRRTDVDVEEIGGQTRTVGSAQTGSASTIGSSTTAGSTMGGATDEGVIERGASSLGNAVERATGSDIDSDGDVGQRDPRNNI